MSEIKAGDLVMVVKPTVCCGNYKNMGRVFVVTRLAGGFGLCGLCNRSIDDIDALTPFVGKHGHNLWFSASRLIKIDPPALPESIEREQETT